MAPNPFRCGSVALLGRPNVGKSTLLNHLVGQKISITSRKAQTTRHRIRGVRSESDAQYVFVDTPGFQTQHSSALHRAMNQSVRAALAEVNVAIWVVEALKFDRHDAQVLDLIPAALPLVAVVNKVDRLADKKKLLLPYLQRIAQLRNFAALVPVSAKNGTRLEELLQVLRDLLPEGEPWFSGDALTDRNERFLAAEFLREKMFRQLGEEIPYQAGVVIDRFEQEGELCRVHANIVVGKVNHRSMVIGEGGERLKSIASDARLEMERLFGGKVYLEVWVTVRGGWTDDARLVKSLGYDET